MSLLTAAAATSTSHVAVQRTSDTDTNQYLIYVVHLVRIDGMYAVHCNTVCVYILTTGRIIEMAIPALTVSIRNADETDLDAILCIYNEAIPRRIATADLEPQSIESRRLWYRNRDIATRPVVVAFNTVTNDICGWGSYTNFKDRTAYSPTAEISIYIAERYARKGVGKMILDYMLIRAVECGIDKILAICLSHNESSLTLFKSRGFTQWGMLPDACEMDGIRRSVTILGLSM